MVKFLLKLLTAQCCAPDCNLYAAHYVHGIPTCEAHTHEPECGVWVDLNCDCGKEAA